MKANKKTFKKLLLLGIEATIVSGLKMVKKYARSPKIFNDDWLIFGKKLEPSFLIGNIKEKGASFDISRLIPQDDQSGDLSYEIGVGDPEICSLSKKHFDNIVKFGFCPNCVGEDR